MAKGHVLTVAFLAVLVSCAWAADSTSSLQSIQFGSHVYGPEVDPGKLAGHIVIIGFTDIEYEAPYMTTCGVMIPARRCHRCLSCFERFSKWQTDFEGQGLAAVILHVEQDINEVKQACIGMDARCSVYSGSNISTFGELPHAIIFDHTGKRVFRGSAVGDTVFPALRAALAKAPFPPLAERELTGLKSISDSLQNGGKAAAALAKAQAAADGKDPVLADEGRFIVEKLTEWGKSEIEAASAKKGSDPQGCLARLRKIANSFAGTDIAKQAAELSAQLNKDEDFVKELNASRVLARIKQAEREVKMSYGDNDNLTGEKFQKRNAAVFSRIRNDVMMMRKKYPDTNSLTTAEAIANTYGLFD